MAEAITAATREKGCTVRTRASSAERPCPSMECAAWGGFMTQDDCRTSPPISRVRSSFLIVPGGVTQFSSTCVGVKIWEAGA